MSKNISVKINNGNKTIETVKLNSANQKVIIKAQPHVNYELVDEATQYAPEMIDTKRVGNDLHIAFEGTDINKESDLVLEGYYEHDNTELVLGMAEDGQYYAYVPQSGVESDAVTLLADQIFAPQALGGNSVAAPFWAFNPNWLWVAAGVAAVGGIIAAASGSHGGGSSNNSNNNSNTAKDTTAPAKPTVEAKDNGSVEVTPPADADTQSVEVNYTDEAGTPKTATLTKGEDGNWTSNNPDVAVDPATGKATIPADKVKDGSPVTAKATDTSGNTGEEGTANAGNNPDTTAPAQPTVEAKMNGFVYITPPSDEDTKSVEVRYIDEKGNPQTVTITKDADKGWVSSNPNDDIWLNSETGKITLLAHKVKGDSPVNASATDNQGNTGEEATANAVDILDTYAPSMPETYWSSVDHSMGVAMPTEANVGDSVVIKRSLHNEHNNWGMDDEHVEDTYETLATLTKQQDGSWISDKPEIVSNVDVGNNRSIVSSNELEKPQSIYLYAIDPAGNTSIAASTSVSGKESPPKIIVKTDGFVEITPPAVQDLKSMKVSYIDKAGTRKFTTLTKGEDGTWTSDNPDVTVEQATGKAMISLDKIQADSTLSASAFNNSDIISRWIYKSLDTTTPSAPEVIPSTTDGSVTIKVPHDAKVGDMLQLDVFPETSGVFFDPENYLYYDISFTKTTDGRWVSSNYTYLPDIEADQDSITIPQDKIRDGYDVTASLARSGSVSPRVTVQAGKDTGDAKDEGSVLPNNVGSSGDDYASFEKIVGTLNMGEGNDILEAHSTDYPFFLPQYLRGHIDMGSGNDIVRTSGPIRDDYDNKGPSINGGEDFDTLEFVNRDGKAIMSSILGLSNFEKIDIKGTLNNTVNIQKDDVERNHNAKAIVDDSGKSHNNVLIVDGDEGDKVNLNDISNVASSQVTYEGNTYHVYHTGSNELWIDSDIAVV